MIRRPPISTRTDTSFPTRRSSDLHSRLRVRLRWWAVTTIRHRAPMVRPPVARRRAVPRRVARLPVAGLPAEKLQAEKLPAENQRVGKHRAEGPAAAGTGRVQKSTDDGEGGEAVAEMEITRWAT